MNAAASTFLPTLPDSANKSPEVINSNRDSEPQRNDPTNPFKHITETLEKKKWKKKLPDFRAPIFPTPLQWIDAVKDGEVCAEVLCSADLIEVYRLIFKDMFILLIWTQLPGTVSSEEPVTNSVGIPSEICPNVAYYKSV